MNDDRLCQSVVFVLTTSKDKHDRATAYQHNIAGYILKNQIGDDLTLIGRLLEGYFAAVNFPDCPD